MHQGLGIVGRMVGFSVYSGMTRECAGMQACAEREYTTVGLWFSVA